MVVLYPIAISVSQRYLQFCEVLLWCNAHIPIKQLSMLSQRNHNDVIPFIAGFINFVNIIDKCKEYISNQINNIIPNELIDVLMEYTLPINAYDGVNTLLQQLKTNNLSEWREIEQIAMDKLNKESNKNNIITIGIDNEKN